MERMMRIDKYILVLFCTLIGSCASTKEIKEPIAITEKVIVEKQKPVLYVFHDEDGDWQFLSAEDTKMVEVFTLPLREMFEYDVSLKEISDLPKGWRAKRSDSSKVWERINIKDIKIYKNK